MHILVEVQKVAAPAYSSHRVFCRIVSRSVSMDDTRIGYILKLLSK